MALHPLEFLRLVLEDEMLSRKDRTAKALVTKARFRFRADLEDWDYSFHKDVPKATDGNDRWGSEPELAVCWCKWSGS